ncbi:hypothetical protein [Dyadobacter alkalitolerans]|uniref:hypothetical protein n=1 Tax=Dyadobacter alkalitolerans TaxID=492736 RepID=UPI000478E46E|nr:hypothetical protein [Dyadobacter alkalitolerans]
MNRNVLLRLYERKDSKRKRLLYDLFKDTIAMSASLSMIADLINQELGQKDLIRSADIKYCRHYFRGKDSQSCAVKEINQAITKPPSTDQNLREADAAVILDPKNWTNPDADKTNSNSSRKSKFSNK